MLISDFLIRIMPRVIRHSGVAESRSLTQEPLGALSGLFPIDDTLEKWLRYKATESALYKSTELSDALTSERFSHQRIDDLFANPSSISADNGARYSKYLHMNLSTLSPHIS